MEAAKRVKLRRTDRLDGKTNLVAYNIVKSLSFLKVDLALTD